MQIRMLDTWAYDVVPGQIRRTLPAGQTFDEPVEIAQAAIDAGAAERLVAIAPLAASPDADPLFDEVEDEEARGEDDPAAAPALLEEGGNSEPAPAPIPLGDAEPAPVPAAPEPVAAKPGRGRTPAAVIPAPAEPVEPV